MKKHFDIIRAAATTSSFREAARLGRKHKFEPKEILWLCEIAEFDDFVARRQAHSGRYQDKHLELIAKLKLVSERPGPSAEVIAAFQGRERGGDLRDFVIKGWDSAALDNGYSRATVRKYFQEWQDLTDMQMACLYCEEQGKEEQEPTLKKIADRIKTVRAELRKDFPITKSTSNDPHALDFVHLWRMDFILSLGKTKSK